MNIKECLKKGYVILDGGMGTLLQREGLAPGELPERWNLTHPDVIKRIHRDYFDSGSNIVNANTFGANSLKFSPSELEGIISSAIKNAKEAMGESSGRQEKWVALDIGPTGRMLEPLGDLSFEEAVEIFAQTVRLGVKHGADLVFIETMSDSYETKAALLAAKENSSLPVLVSCAYGKDGKLMTGASPAAMTALLEGMGADAIGVNCSLGPADIKNIVKEYLHYSSLPIIVKPNAGMPRVDGGQTVYDVSPDSFAEDMRTLVSMGATVVGGCCGTTPEYIGALKEAISDIPFAPSNKKDITLVSSYSRAVEIGKIPVIIGERINPTGKKRFKEALRSRDVDYILREAITEEDDGADILDVNVGLPEIDETEMLTTVIKRLQAVTPLPLQIDTSDFDSMEAALRIYNGKPLINSVSGKEESLEKILPLAKKYGGTVIALCLDGNGIPEKAEGRLEIARKILEKAKEYGIDEKDIVFDPLALTVSADKQAGRETLRAVRMISEELGCHTSLGVSNVSFGLPGRDSLNASFLTSALTLGLSAAIVNPHSREMMQAFYTHNALMGLDDGFKTYIEFSENNVTQCVKRDEGKEKAQEAFASEIEMAIVKGLGSLASEATKELIVSVPPLDIIEKHVIPALDRVGRDYECGRAYLPGLLMSAEAARESFDVIKAHVGASAGDKCKVILATVEGDIHDIGKNIVKLLLENYGFCVTDLGRDVKPERIVSEVLIGNAPIVGLSALMTTTVPAMERTIALIKEKAPKTKVIVGGAVLTEEYAQRIGADYYAKDAMEGVRIASEIFEASKSDE